MKITPHLLEAFLKYPTKCWLRFTGEPPTGNAYAEWVETQKEHYHADAVKRLVADASADEGDTSSGGSRVNEAPFSPNDLKTAKWHLAFDVILSANGIHKLRSSRREEAQISSPQLLDQSLVTSAATRNGFPPFAA